MVKQAWIISIDMGYGHQRAAYPFKDIAWKHIITINNDALITSHEQKSWRTIQHFYENLSRMKDIPVIGNLTFGVYDQLQKISPMYPFRDLSAVNMSVKYLKRKILKEGMCKTIVTEIAKTKLPVISTHFIPALAMEYSRIKNKHYCVVTDTDLNRAWVPDNPATSKIIYLAPTRHAIMRLREYGIKEKNIIFTGFPLPKELIADKHSSEVKKDLGNRLPNLDPKGIYRKRYKSHLERVLGKRNIKEKSDHPLTIMYLVGGAGAQKRTGMAIAKSLKEHILKKKVRLILVAGIRREVADYFKKSIDKLGLSEAHGKHIKIIHENTKDQYFIEMNKELHKTDIIWTKPSEMVFYAGLGLPIICTAPLGAHESFNLEWLQHIGSGYIEERPEYTKDWLFYWLESGRFAESAVEGFIEAPTLGTYHIQEVVLDNRKVNITKESFY